MDMPVPLFSREQLEPCVDAALEGAITQRRLCYAGAGGCLRTRISDGCYPSQLIRSFPTSSHLEIPFDIEIVGY
jgi:hypothetical protein